MIFAVIALAVMAFWAMIWHDSASDLAAPTSPRITAETHDDKSYETTQCCR
jgi:hypothetical protein